MVRPPGAAPLAEATPAPAASEPAALRLLDAMCRFEVLRSLGDTEHHPWLRRASSQRSSRTDHALRLGNVAGDAGHRARA